MHRSLTPAPTSSFYTVQHLTKHCICSVVLMVQHPPFKYLCFMVENILHRELSVWVQHQPIPRKLSISTYRSILSPIENPWSFIVIWTHAYLHNNWYNLGNNFNFSIRSSSYFLCIGNHSSKGRSRRSGELLSSSAQIKSSISLYIA